MEEGGVEGIQKEKRKGRGKVEESRNGVVLIFFFSPLSFSFSFQANQLWCTIRGEETSD